MGYLNNTELRAVIKRARKALKHGQYYGLFIIKENVISPEDINNDPVDHNQ